jgi:hypothetical protein
MMVHRGTGPCMGSRGGCGCLSTGFGFVLANGCFLEPSKLWCCLFDGYFDNVLST